MARKRDLAPERVLDLLDARSRQRALTEAESAALEHAIRAVDDGDRWRLTKRGAARLGIKRDMRVY